MSNPIAQQPPASPFVTGEEMLEAFKRGERMTVIDSHWARTENSAWEAYVGQHIPGAMCCNPRVHRASIPSRHVGRNPLPAPEELQKSFNDWGITDGRPVYIYDAGANLYAARAWFVFRWAGVQNVRILDGGTGAWEAAGGDVAGGIGALRGRGTTEVRAGSMPTLELDEVNEWRENHILVDARENSRFTGKKERFDHQAGRIPGAINIPVKELFQNRSERDSSASGKVRSPEEIRQILANHGVTSGGDVCVYSGSGLHSSLFIAAMEYAGLPGAKNFVGGWSQWSASSSRPIARG